MGQVSIYSCQFRKYCTMVEKAKIIGTKISSMEELTSTQFKSILSKYYMTSLMKVKWKWKSLSHVQLFATPLDYTHGSLQIRILQWVAIPFSRGSCQPRDWTQAFNITGIFFTSWATREALTRYTWNLNKRGYKRTYLQNRNRVTDKKLNYGYWKVRGER